MLFGKSRSGIVILLGLMLTVVPARSVFGQITQQHQQEEQQREQQAREQQQREQQAREEQQRQEQQREQQAREQQQREQQERERQAREDQQRQEQQREQQQREQQAREQQQRDQRLREEQERQRQTPGNPASSSTVAFPSMDSSVSTKPNAATESHVPSQPQPGVKPVVPRAQTPEPDVRTNGAASDGKKTPAKDQNLRLPAPDLRHKPCDEEPCGEPGPKPVSPSDLHAKVCKDGPCPICAPGQSPGKHNSCVSATLAKGAIAPSKTSAVPQACPAGQIWNGIQCAPVGAQQCLPGQAGTSASCQTDCTIATAEAQNYIELLRMARQDKDQACTRNPTQQECQQAESTYNIRLNEYRTFLAGVSTTCTLPDPISI